MASGLAARIKDIFGMTPQLVEGHNGIYKVVINGQVIATNQGKCSGISTDEEILQQIRKHRSPLPGKEKMVKTVIPLMKG
jgi:hypothetical protein